MAVKKKKPLGTAPEVRRTIDTIMGDFNKKHGSTIVLRGSDLNRNEIPRITSGLLAVDVMLGGGWPLNQFHEIIGDESCLAPDTFVGYQVRTPDGKIINSKGGTIATLWRRMHGEPHHNASTVEVEYYTASVNEEDRIITNRIEDVICTGQQECFLVETVGGRSITATGNHRFYTGEGFSRLKDMTPGQLVGVHNRTPYTSESSPERIERQYICVQHHPVAGVKVVRDKARGYEYIYRHLSLSRAVMEAHLNGLEFDNYIERLNNGVLEGLTFLPRDMHVHHINEDFTDNALTNLALIHAVPHGQHHAAERHNNLRYMVVYDTVKSITPMGMSLTYDIKMADPFRTYVANEFVVHNSGKTALVMKTVAANMERDSAWECLWVAAEPFMPRYAEAIGIDLNRLTLVETNIMEDVYEVVLDAMGDRAVDCIVIDSLPALVSQSEEEQTMADFVVGVGARLTGKFLRKSGKAQRRSLVEEDDRDCVGFIINQWRERIGVTHGDPRTTPGGRAKNYHYMIRIEMRHDEWLVDAHKNKVGQSIVMRTIKNKSYKPQQMAGVDYYFENFGEHKKMSFDMAKQVVLMAIEAEIITKRGAWFYFGEEKWNGAAATVAAIRVDPTVYAAVHTAVFKHYLPGVTVPPVPKAQRLALVKEPAKRRVVRRG